MELSQNVQKSGLTARVAFEPTSYIASTGVDPLNRHTVHASLANLCFSAIQKMDKQGVFDASSKVIETCMQTQSQTDLCFLSCDLIDLAKTRIKLYLLELDMRLEKVQEHLTMFSMQPNAWARNGSKALRVICTAIADRT